MDAPPVPLRAVVFDFGGVVQRAATTSRAALVAQHLGLPLPAVRAQLAAAQAPVKRGQLAEDVFWRDFAAALGGRVANDAAWANVLAAHYLAPGLHGDVLALARQLAKMQIMTPLCSNTVTSRAALNARRGAYAPFWPRLLSCEVGVVKPEPAMFAALVQATGLPPAAHLLVDDKPANVQAAQEFGLRGHVFVGLPDLRAALRAQHLAV